MFTSNSKKRLPNLAWPDIDADLECAKPLPRRPHARSFDGRKPER